MNGSIDRLFDQPGPIGLRKVRIYSLIALVALLTLLGITLYAFYMHGGLSGAKWKIFTYYEVLRLLTKALYSTLAAAFSAGLLALALGTGLALLRMSRQNWIRIVVGGYVEITRSLPTLLILYFTVLMLPYYGIHLPVYWQLVLALVVTNGAMISEILRASLLSVPIGQLEASVSLGLTRSGAFLYTVLPQGFRAAMPALVAQVIYLLKNTVLGYVISYEELLYTSRMIGEYTGYILQSYLVIAFIFLIVNVLLSRFAYWLDSRLMKYGNSNRSLRIEN